MTVFGKLLRRERQERKLLLGDLARALKISTPYLSQIENGRRAVPDGFVDKVAKALSLSQVEANELDRAAAAARSQFLISIADDAEDEDRGLAAELALTFARLSPEAKAKIRATLKDDRHG